MQKVNTLKEVRAMDDREAAPAGKEVEPEGIAGVKTPKPKDDSVKSPSHYQLFDGTESIEVIARAMTVSEFRGFCFGNVLKYRLRAGKKSDLANMEQDLNKAAFYQELFDKHKGLCYGKSE